MDTPAVPTAQEAVALRAGAREALRRGDLEARVTLLRSLVALPGRSHADLSALADALFDARRFLDAEALLRAAHEESPDDLHVQFLLGSALNRMGRRAACCEAVRAAALDPRTPRGAAFMLGFNLRGLGLLPEAREAFARLPQEVAGFWGVERQGCEEAFARAEQRAADPTAPWHERLHAFAALDRREEFAAAFAALDAAKARSPHAAAARAILALRDGGAAAAAAVFAEAAAASDAPALRLEWALHLMDAGRYEEAEAVLLGIDQEKRPAAAWVLLARLLLLTKPEALPAEFVDGFLDRFPQKFEASSTFVLRSLAAGHARRFTEPETVSATAREAVADLAIVQFWHGVVPEDVRPLIAGWQQRNPGLRHELFDEGRARSFLAANFGEETAQLFDHCHHAAMKSDFFRLGYLLLHGGVYVDADEVCQRSILPVVEALDRTECVVYMRGGLMPYLNNSFIAARPRARVIATAFRDVAKALRAARAQGLRPNIWEATGPGALTRAAASALRAAMADGASPVTMLEVMTEGQLTTLSHTNEQLAYKRTSEGDWRSQKAQKAAGALDMSSLGQTFGAKYEPGSDWGGHSGGGSSPAHMGPYVHFVEHFIHLNQLRSVTDIGCGDWVFSRFLNFGRATYTGYDVVPQLIARNRLLYSREGIRFETMPGDLSSLPGGDLVLIKDVLQHLPIATVQEMLARILPKFRFALITNSYRKHGATPLNGEISTGGFRPLDLTAKPFDLQGSYVLEFPSAHWELLRTLLVIRAPG
jgi:tetratricopeptide (TPR) repeat protein/2-polyprenyl-3-methyl-5-hydroxy-6-metoxy-1,4-benzoquinol methylase